MCIYGSKILKNKDRESSFSMCNIHSTHNTETHCHITFWFLVQRAHGVFDCWLLVTAGWRWWLSARDTCSAQYEWFNRDQRWHPWRYRTLNQIRIASCRITAICRWDFAIIMFIDHCASTLFKLQSILQLSTRRYTSYPYSSRAKNALFTGKIMRSVNDHKYHTLNQTPRSSQAL